MAEVIFEDSDFDQATEKAAVEVPKSSFAEVLIKNRFARTEREANFAMLACVAAIIAVSAVVFSATNQEPRKTYEELRMLRWINEGNLGRPPENYRPSI